MYYSGRQARTQRALEDALALSGMGNGQDTVYTGESGGYDVGAPEGGVQVTVPVRPVTYITVPQAYRGRPGMPGGVPVRQAVVAPPSVRRSMQAQRLSAARTNLELAQRAEAATRAALEAKAQTTQARREVERTAAEIPGVVVTRPLARQDTYLESLHQSQTQDIQELHRQVQELESEERFGEQREQELAQIPFLAPWPRESVPEEALPMARAAAPSWLDWSVGREEAAAEQVRQEQAARASRFAEAREAYQQGQYQAETERQQAELAQMQQEAVESRRREELRQQEVLARMVQETIEADRRRRQQIAEAGGEAFAED